MVRPYGYTQQIIETLDVIQDNSTNVYNYKGLNFLSKLSHKNNHLVICFHGAVQGRGTNRIVFRGYNYNLQNTDMVCVTDYLLNVYDDYKVNWTLSTKKYDVESIYEEVFDYIIHRRPYTKVIFTGTSAGGYPSLKFACTFHCTALLSNSQIYLEDYGAGTGWGMGHLKAMLAKNDDTLLYSDKEIETILCEHKPKHVILYNNINDSTYKRDLVPLLQYIKDNDLSHLFTIHTFEYTGVIPAGWTQHHIQFPGNQRHMHVLQQLIHTD